MAQKLSVQAPKSVVMIRPHRFMPNPATAADDAFQSDDARRSAAAIAEAAFNEASNAARRLEITTGEAIAENFLRHERGAV